MLLWLLSGNSRSAAAWAVSVGFCVGLTLLLKIVFYGCPPTSDLRGPSGHTGFSVLVYGSLTLMTAIQVRGLPRRSAVSIGAGLILAIAASRLLLEIHSLLEVSLGLVIGTVSLILFGRHYLQSPQAHVWPLLVAAGMLMTILHGQELHAEEFLQRITGYVRVHVRFYCPASRMSTSLSETFGSGVGSERLETPRCALRDLGRRPKQSTLAKSVDEPELRR
jgi:hypothetical protein